MHIPISYKKLISFERNLVSPDVNIPNIICFGEEIMELLNTGSSDRWKVTGTSPVFFPPWWDMR